MRIVRLALGIMAAASLAVITPAQGAGTLTGPCALTNSTRTGGAYTGTLSSGFAVSNDDTSPEIICSIQTTPQPKLGVITVQSSRGIACVNSTCTGDYWVCALATCEGDGFVCVASSCYSGSVCVNASCTPPDNVYMPSRATWLTPRAVEFAAPQGPLFTCTTVRWHRADTVAGEQFYGCTPVG